MVGCFSLKEFDELQEKKIQVSEQFRTIVGPSQGAGMNMTTGMGYQGGRQQQQQRYDGLIFNKVLIENFYFLAMNLIE